MRHWNPQDDQPINTFRKFLKIISMTLDCISQLKTAMGNANVLGYHTVADNDFTGISMTPQARRTEALFSLQQPQELHEAATVF